MTPLPWPTKAEEHAHMRKRKAQNTAKALKNTNENWFADKLKDSTKKWSRQAVWGCRIFDFWCHELGVAIEIDGPEHNKKKDAYRDEYNYRRSGIIVLRVRNKNEEDAAQALEEVSKSLPWKDRRKDLGLNAKTKKGRRHLVKIYETSPKSI
jgi:very-short-patch-repair endonuclease